MLITIKAIVNSFKSKLTKKKKKKKRNNKKQELMH